MIPLADSLTPQPVIQKRVANLPILSWHIREQVPNVWPIWPILSWQIREQVPDIQSKIKT